MSVGVVPLVQVLFLLVLLIYFRTLYLSHGIRTREQRQRQQRRPTRQQKVYKQKQQQLRPLSLIIAQPSPSLLQVLQEMLRDLGSSENKSEGLPCGTETNFSSSSFPYGCCVLRHGKEESFVFILLLLSILRFV